MVEILTEPDFSSKLIKFKSVGDAKNIFIDEYSAEYLKDTNYDIEKNQR